MHSVQHHRPLAGILFMAIGMFCISINDMTVKSLAGDYALHQLILIRACIALAITTVLLQMEGGFSTLRVKHAWLHVLRCVCIVIANSAFYCAMVAMPLAMATAIYFIAPLFVTVLAIPILGETVGPRRIAAVSFGFVGVLVILWPEIRGASGLGWIVLLPLLAAAGYATMSVLTRKLGATASASVLSFWVQIAFLISGVLMFFFASDGRYMQGDDASASAAFLLRPWVWPETKDLWVIALLGVISGIVGYVMAQAYRLAAASVVAPFEYILLLYALFWGWFIFGEWPAPTVFVGAGIIVASGVFVVWRARKDTPV